MYIPGAMFERYVCQPLTDPNLEFLDEVCILAMNLNQNYLTPLYIPFNEYDV